MYEPVTNTYNERLPNLNYKKSSFGCTVFNSKYHGGRPVVLVAGGDYNHVELYDYTVPNAVWTESKSTIHCFYEPKSFNKVIFSILL